MDIPPLAGKIAALSLGAVPVSYALNHVSALSQCVLGLGGWVEDGGEGLGDAEGAGERMRARRAWLRASPAPPGRSGPGGWGLGQNPQPEVPFLLAQSLCAGDRGAPRMFEV